MTQSLGFFKTLYSASVRPRAFFEQWSQGEVRAHQLWVYAAGQACASVGEVLLEILSASTTREGSSKLVLGLAAASLVTAPVSWLYSAAILHGLTRLFGVRGTFREAGAAVGYSGAPRVLGFLPLVNYVVEVWAIVVTVRGLQVLRGLRALPATALALSPVLLSVGLALVLRAAVMEAFKMPSGSMYPSLEVGDHLFVSKLGAARRGDIIVFEEPYPRSDNEPDQLLKRVIGLPGETLSVDEGQPIIDGWRVPRCPVGKALLSEPLDPTEKNEIEIFVEFLEGRAYLVARDPERADRKEGPYVVAPSELFVLGDNRNNSADSRAWRDGRGAGVPFEKIGGVAWFLWFPISRLGVPLDGAPVLPSNAAHLQPMLDRCLAKAPSAEQTRPPAR
jgi:signal peptidase I